ncbi:MAG: hypothetical protein VZQ55_03640 [Ruminococcus sp.]|jgi:uncharacterized membrane protein YraQ (UPF0718 family)|nr:hypothetical protein [Ruminococcus sp.]
MFQKHIKVVSLVLVLCLIAVMFIIASLLGSGIANASPVMLLLFVAIACVPIYLAHEKHD